jgi:outer membrane cobalamin receptor
MKSRSFSSVPRFVGIATLSSSLLGSSVSWAEGVTVLQEIVVTAAGRAQALADVQASVEVVDRKAIERYSGASVTEILRSAAGIDARTSGPNESVSIRGQKSNGTLILFDGMPRTGTYGSTNLNNFPLEEVERIEIIRGPMSALYGADALGGVVNIITKRPGLTPGKRFTTTLGIRPDDGQRPAANLSASAEAGDEFAGQRFSLDARFADGYALPGTTIGEDFSAISHLAVTYSGAYSPTDETDLRWRLEAFRQDDRRDAYSPPAPPQPGLEYTALEQEDRFAGEVSLRQRMGDGELTVQGLTSYSEGMSNRSFPSPDEETRHFKGHTQARYDLQLGDHMLSTAVGARYDHIDVDINSQVGRQTQLFALAQDEWLINDWLSVTAGVRLDHFDSFGSTVNPRVVVGSRGDGFTWRAGFGTAFRAPTVLEQYSTFNRGRFLIVGNPDLQPETSRSYEVAVGWRDASWSAELVYHNSRVEDLITTHQTSRVVNGLVVTEYTNVDSAKIQGVELTGSWQALDNLELSGSLEYLDAHDGVTGERLTERYRTAYRLSATYTKGPWDFTGRVRGMQGYFAPDPNVRGATPFNSGFTVVDLNVGYEINENLKLNFGVDNVFNEDFPINYSTSRYREDAGRFAYVSLRGSF